MQDVYAAKGSKTFWHYKIICCKKWGNIRNFQIDKRIYFVYTSIKDTPIIYKRRYLFTHHFRSQSHKRKTKDNTQTNRETGNTMNTNTNERLNNMINVFTTQTVIRKWGNSQGIRLSKELLAQMDLRENDMIGINVYDGKMTIEKINRPKYLNLEERLEAFYKRPIDEIFVESTPEVEVDGPVGNEQW